MTRIISGRYGGLHLLSPAHRLRPTADKVKEYMFNVCRDFPDSITADLFSGTGALGIEALSRGAGEVHCVDNDSRSCDLIRKNIARLRDAGGITVFRAGAEQFLKNREGVYDHIIADPPYAYKLPEDFFMLCRRALKPGGRMIFEYGSSWKGSADTGMDLLKQKKFGETGVWIYERHSEESDLSGNL